MPTTGIHDLDSYTHALDLAEEINDAYRAGVPLLVNGRQVASFARSVPPATVYGNGTLAVSVLGRKVGTFGTVYVKAGETADVRFGL